MKQEKLSRRLIYNIALDVTDGKADPEDARRLLEYFCDCHDSNEPIDPYLVSHLRDAFRRYLDGEKTLEAALGLVRKKGQPSKNKTQLALEVARHRFAGTPHQEALSVVAERFDCAESTVGEAWRKHQLEAYLELRRERKNPWSEEEVGRLIAIFNKLERRPAPK